MAKAFRLTAPKPFIPKEYDEQVEVFNWLATCQLDGADMAFGSLGGIRLPIGLAVKAKKAGNKPGVTDILIDVARHGFHGFRGEMKREKGGVLSGDQESWHIRLREEGYYVCVARGAKAMIDEIKEYLR